MTTEKLTALAISLGMVYVGYKYGPKVVSAAAVAVGGVIVAKQIPYIKDQLA